MTPHQKLMSAYEKAPHGMKRTTLKALQRQTHEELKAEIEARYAAATPAAKVAA